MPPRPFLVVLVLAWLAPLLVAAADRDALALAAASITADELKEIVGVLADDTFEGREAGSRGGHAAANYVVKAFQTHGVVPAGDGGTYFQAFNGACRNVLGFIEGGDSLLKDQVIVLCAHYDHVGYGRSNNSFGPLGYIHNGADDNASGVAGLLEVLDALQQLPTAPRRSILLACFDSEESGLAGSRHWVSRPTIPLANIACAINIDMLGRMRDQRLEVYGTRTSLGMRRLVSEANGEGPARIDFVWKLKPDSDHWSFLERRLPILMFHTGLHGDYHRPSDDVHLINFAGLQSSARLVFQTLVRMTDDERRLTFRDVSRQESALSSASLEQPAASSPPRFGLPFRFEAGDPPHVVVGAPNPGLPAERAGLKSGDWLIAFQGEPITSEQELRLKLLAARGETTFLVQRAGVNTPLLLKVTPDGEPVRVGISWRLDSGEPGTAIVTQVIHGSAAHAAGIRLGDRIYALDGRGFGTQEELIERLTAAPNPLQMLVERQGQLHNVWLTLIDEPPAAE